MYNHNWIRLLLLSVIYRGGFVFCTAGLFCVCVCVLSMRRKVGETGFERFYTRWGFYGTTQSKEMEHSSLAFENEVAVCRHHHSRRHYYHRCSPFMLIETKRLFPCFRRRICNF